LGLRKLCRIHNCYGRAFRQSDTAFENDNAVTYVTRYDHIVIVGPTDGEIKCITECGTVRQILSRI
jgi:hypothetical protein